MTIAEVLRRAWERLVRKQWLILYPLALGIISSMAFFAVYAAEGNSLTWNDFFIANFYRWTYVRDHLVSEISWSPALAAAVFAGLAICGLMAMIRAPYFRAIAGMGYPRGPRNLAEAGRLTLFYLMSNLVLVVLPLALPNIGPLTQIAALVIYVVLIVIIFTDYIIVFEQLPFLRALRRSVRLVGRRWISVVLVVLVWQLIMYGLSRLYDSY